MVVLVMVVLVNVFFFSIDLRPEQATPRRFFSDAAQGNGPN